MNLKYLTDEALDNFISLALKEDIGDGDHTTLSTIPSDAYDDAHIIAKEPGIIAGVELATRIYGKMDPSVQVEVLKEDGSSIVVGDIILRIHGSSRTILTGERVVLNCMQRMSGIATYTRGLVDKIEAYEAKLLDTRKTGPNFRIIEKWAVAIGGGQNHRYGLFDMIMIKDNHIDFAGGITQAIQAVKAYLKEKDLVLRIEVETRNLKEVQLVLEEGGVDVIMLDNMSPTLMKEAVAIIGKRAQTEASGNINEHTIIAAAESGVDYISMGALTHSYKSIDLSMKATKEQGN